MSTPNNAEVEGPALGLFVGGGLLALSGLAGLIFLFALVDLDEPRLRGVAVTMGLAPAALLSVSAQVALLVGCRMLFLAWRRSGRVGSQASQKLRHGGSRTSGDHNGLGWRHLDRGR